MNKVILMGFLARDPEVRYSQSAEPVAICRYAIAVNRKFKREGGDSDVDFINCVSFGKTAEFAEKYFKKGMRILISGRIQVSSWDDPQSGQKRWNTEVVIEEQEFAESKASFESRSATQGSYSSAPPKPSYEPEGFSAISESIEDEDLPF